MVLTPRGVVGAIPYLIALAIIARAVGRARRGGHGITAVALLAMHFLGAMSGNPISSKMFWLVLAYAVAAEAEIVPVAVARVSRGFAPPPPHPYPQPFPQHVARV